MARPERTVMLAQFKRVSAARLDEGVWTQADADALAASIKAALDSKDLERIQAAADYLADEVEVLDALLGLVRDANSRLKALAVQQKTERERKSA